MSFSSRLLLSFILVSSLVVSAGMATGATTSNDAQAVETSGASAAGQVAELADLPSLSGASGLFHTSTASPVRARTLRLGLYGQFFSATDFLVPGDSNRQLRRDLVFSYSPTARLELFGAWGDSANHNRRIRLASDVDPEVIRTVGDASIGIKGWIPLASVLNVGFEAGLKFRSGASDLLWSPSATSGWLGPIITFQAPSHLPVPFRAHVAVNYFADRSSHLGRLADASLAARRVAGFAYGISGSRLRGTLAVDIPWSAVSPALPIGIAFAEYGWEYVTGDPDANFRELIPPICGASTAAPACAERRGAQRLTVGFKGVVYRNLVAELGLDLVLGSATPPYGPPLPPHNLIFGLAYPFELDAWLRHDAPGVGNRAPPSATSGTSSVEGTDTRVTEEAMPPVDAMNPPVVPPPSSATSPSPLPSVSPSLPRPPPLAQPAPELRARSMMLRGRVVDPTGRGLQAALVVRGTQQSFETVSDGQGLFEISLLAGKHVVRVQSPGFELQELQIDAVGGTESTIEVRLQPPSLDPTVQLEARAIKVGRAIRFVNGGTELTAESQLVLKSVGEVLGVHPEISLVRIVAFWDDSLAKATAEDLTLRQAEAVRTFLVGRGVAPTRLVAAGGGAVLPPAPGATPATRMRSRRVEFQIVR